MTKNTLDQDQWDALRKEIIKEIESRIKKCKDHNLNTSDQISHAFKGIDGHASFIFRMLKRQENE